MTKEEIFRVTLKLSKEHSLNKISMRMISKEVGCSPSTLYHHFRDKEDLFLQLYDRIIGCMPTNFPTDFKVALHGYFRRSCAHSLEYRFMHNMKNADFIPVDKRKVYENMRLERIQQFNALIHENCVDIDITYINILIGGTFNELLKRDNVSEEDINIIVELIFDGIAKEKR